MVQVVWASAALVAASALADLLALRPAVGLGLGLAAIDPGLAGLVPAVVLLAVAQSLVLSAVRQIAEVSSLALRLRRRTVVALLALVEVWVVGLAAVEGRLRAWACRRIVPCWSDV